MAEFQHAYLSMMLYLGRYFIEACEDLHDSAAGNLHTRFLGWARAPEVRSAVAGRGPAPAEK